MTSPITDNPPTPTPWEASGLSGRVHGRGTIYHCPTPQNGGVMECTANTAFIVRACNSFGELMALAYQYRNDLLYPPAPDSVERRLAAIEAVIAKATEAGNGCL